MKLLQPILSQLITSSSFRQKKEAVYYSINRIKKTSNVIHYFHRVNDPYSYLMTQLLEKFVDKYQLVVVNYVVLDLPANGYPNPDLQNQYAWGDARYLADYYRLDWPAKIILPSVEECFKATGIILSAANSTGFFQLAKQVTELLMSGEQVNISDHKNDINYLSHEAIKQKLNNNLAKLVSMGHYLSATLYYAGEWYWGLDRLGHLENRLRRLKNQENGNRIIIEPKLQFSNKSISTQKKSNNQLDFYFSFRSPYSYLALERLFKLVDYYGIALHIKPIFPMVNRGLPAPRVKRFYIVKDAKREAERLSIPFGKICDPLGSGISRCFAAFQFADSQHLAREFLLSICEAIWSKGINVASDKGLHSVIDRVGLDWVKVKQALRDTSWQQWAKQYGYEHELLGLWGVPAYRYGDFIGWGQDRLWVLEREILASFDTEQDNGVVTHKNDGGIA